MHYRAFQGLNKPETAEKHGKEQVKIWGKSYDIRPPAFETTDPRFPGFDKRYESLPFDALPCSECLKDTVERVLPFWNDTICSAIKEGKKVIVVAHGNSLRAIVKYLYNVPEAGWIIVSIICKQEIFGLNIPTGVPFVYELDKKLHPIRDYQLASEEELMSTMEAVAAQGTAQKGNRKYNQKLHSIKKNIIYFYNVGSQIKQFIIYIKSKIMENYLKFLQTCVRCFYSNNEIVIIDYIASQLIASNYPLEEISMLTELKFNRNKINEGLAILEKGSFLVKEERDVLQQVANKDKKLVKKYFWKINSHVKSDIEQMIKKVIGVIRLKQVKDKQMQMQCQKCLKQYLPEEFIHDPINADQIGKIHGKKIYRCIEFGCLVNDFSFCYQLIQGNLEEYQKSTEEIEKSKEEEKNCNMIFSKLDEQLKALDSGDWKQQERIFETRKNIMLQQQLELAKQNQEYVGLANQKLYNVNYSLQRRIIKKVNKKRLNLRSLFAMNKSDMHLIVSQKLKRVEQMHGCMKNEIIEDKIQLFQNMVENRNLYQAWNNDDYNRLFADLISKKVC